jgi:hypothetical protein
MKHMGVTIMQYSIYSTQETLLPPLPKTILGEFPTNNSVVCFELTQFSCYFVSLSEFKPQQINFEYFDLVGGQKAFATECGTSAHAVQQAEKVSFKVVCFIYQ